MVSISGWLNYKVNVCSLAIVRGLNQSLLGALIQASLILTILILQIHFI
jgi:hypothetical protein